MALIFLTPSYCFNEVAWVAQVVLNEFLGINYRIDTHEEKDFFILYEGKTLRISNSFLVYAENEALHLASLADVPLLTLDVAAIRFDVSLDSAYLPVLFGSDRFEFHENSIVSGVDIIGTIFFMLSRYEEVVSPDRDQYNRFPATASLAYQKGFLERPIVDEYVELLWACLKQFWPNLTRKKHSAKINVTCDVDRPFDCTVKNYKKLLRTVGGDIVKRKNPLEAMKRVNGYCFNKLGSFRFDPHYTFDWYMDICEQNNLCVTFYFIADNSEPNNGCYSLKERRVLYLIEKIYKRGHKIGLHGSYNTYRNPLKIFTERQKLQMICDKIAPINIEGNRQHYLRWDAAQTPDHLDAAGFTYDSTGGYADHPGFRFGTGREFTMWSWKKKSKLSIKQHPLIFMECSVIEDYYLGLGYSEKAYELVYKLKERTRRYGGNFTFLWHNSSLKTNEERSFFIDTIMY
ncbi:MAG: DUF7033 domain-containing protein [Candidatus Electrothrix sp. YB6]